MPDVFLWVPLAGPSSWDNTFAQRSAKFGDGYEQVAGDGIDHDDITHAVSFLGDTATIDAIRRFLRAHRDGSPFQWSPPLEGPGLYSCGGYHVLPAGGGKFTLSATFKLRNVP